MLVFPLVPKLIALKISTNLEEVKQNLSEVVRHTSYSHRFSPTGNKSKEETLRDLAKAHDAEACRFALI